MSPLSRPGSSAPAPSPSCWPARRPRRLRRRPGAQLSDTVARARVGPTPGRRHGRHVRPDPPRPPGRGLRGAGLVRPRRGRVRAHRAAVAEGGPAGLARRAPLPDDGGGHRRQPAVPGLPRRHRPRPGRPTPSTRCATSAPSTRTPISTSSPAPTPSPTSSAGATPPTCSTWPTSSGCTRPGAELDARRHRRDAAGAAHAGGGARAGHQLDRLPRAPAARTPGLVPRARRRRPVHHQTRPLRRARRLPRSPMTATDHAVDLVVAAARAASDKLAQQIVAFDVSEQLAITDVFLLVSGSNDRQVKAIVDEVEDKLREIGAKPIRREGAARRALGAHRLRRDRRPRAARGGAGVLRPRAAVARLPDDRPPGRRRLARAVTAPAGAAPPRPHGVEPRAAGPGARWTSASTTPVTSRRPRRRRSWPRWRRPCSGPPT